MVSAFVEQLGGKYEELSVTVLLEVRMSDLNGALDACVLEGALFTGLQKGSLIRFLKRVAEVGGVAPPDFGTLGGRTLEPAGAGGPAAAASSNTRKLKRSRFIDQSDDRDFEMLPEPKLRQFAAEFEKTHGGPPREHEEASPEQLSALAAVLGEDAAPYTDLAVWGPFGKQQQKLLRFTAQVFVGGELVTRQVKGPASFDTWRQCWRVFRTAMLTLQACLPGPLDEYEEGMRLLSVAFPNHWGIISRADDEMRSERWERIRRRIESEVAENTYRGSFVQDRPWEAVIRESAKSDTGPYTNWWYEHVDKLCLMVSKAPVALAPAGASAEPAAAPGGASDSGPAPKKARTKDKKQGLASLERRKDGRFLRFEGKELCFSWNRQASGCEPGSCPQGRAHRCEWCLGCGSTGGGRASATVLADTPAAGRKRKLAKLSASLSALSVAFAAQRARPLAERAPARRHCSLGADEESRREQKHWEDMRCTAGMRNATFAIAARPEVGDVMRRVREAIVAIRSSDPVFRGLTECCGASPSRSPPSKEAIRRLRAAVGRALGLPEGEADLAHSASPIRYRLVQQFLALTRDADAAVGSWLESGAPMGIMRQITPGGHFPLAESPRTMNPDELAAQPFAFTANHPSFEDNYGEGEPPTLELIRGYLSKECADTFPDEAAAEARLGPIFPAPLGNVQKVKKDGAVKNRIIQDLKANSVNLTSSTHERVVLPRGVDRGVDLALLAERAARVAGGVVKVLVLDFNDAFMSVPLHEQERRFNVAVLKEPPSSTHGRVIVWRVLGFGGKSNPLVYCRFASAVARSSQGLVPASCGRLQLRVDDPAFSFAGTGADAQLNADVVLAWWLALGLGLAWSKGIFASGPHRWIGIDFEVTDGVTHMSIPAEFLEETMSLLEVFAQRGGVAPMSKARSLVGKAARIAQVVPDATPFAGSLSAALAAAESAANS
ncbi:unnamed protein product, partial [Prorocentrum cordatum]